MNSAMTKEENDVIDETVHNCFVSVKVTPASYKHFKVPPEVYTYIKQLETAIKLQHFTGITKLYPGRFD